MRSEIFIVFILFLCSSAYSQVVELHDSELDSVEHAQYLSGDITKILNAEINYAASALESKIGSTTNLMENNKLAAKKSNVFRAII